RKSGTGRHLVNLARESGPQNAEKAPVLQILSARYEATDGAGGADVTAKIRELVAAGETEITADNGTFGDPTVNHVKQLRVIYTLDGKQMETTARENETLILLESGRDASLPEYEIAGGKLLAFSPGTYVLTDAAGKTARQNVPAAKELSINGP